MAQWVYGLTLDVMSYCGNILLRIMSTDLKFWESSVPIVPTLYSVFVAIGWGLLIGNCAFQGLKAMLAGLGFESEAPVILLLRTALFGFLLLFSREICQIGLSMGKTAMEMLGLPEKIEMTLPTEIFFPGISVAWLLVILVGSLMTFQLIKLFFDIGEKYVFVAIMTMLCPMGLAMGGSKSTKDICFGFIRTYATMIVMMVMNLLFLKLILSALAAMPPNILVLPWCLLIVGITRTARKADQLIARIGLSPAYTGDNLGSGKGQALISAAAKTILNSSGKGSGTKIGSGKTGSSGKSGATVNHAPQNYSGNVGSNVRSSAKSTNTANTNTAGGAAYSETLDQVSASQRSSQGNHWGSNNATTTQADAKVRFGSTAYNSNSQATNSQAGSKVRFGSASYNSKSQAVSSNSGKTQFASTGKTQVNTNRFGDQLNTAPNGNRNQGSNTATKQSATHAEHTATDRSTQSANSRKTIGKGASKGRVHTTAQRPAQPAVNPAKKDRFGGTQKPGKVRENTTQPASSLPRVTSNRIPQPAPSTTKKSAQPDVLERTEPVQDNSQGPQSVKDGDRIE